MNKQQALAEFVTFGPHKAQALDILLSDNSAVSLAISKATLSVVLAKYLSGEIDEDDLENWAGFVELRDEIDCTLIEDYLYALNNPELMGGINLDSIGNMLKLIKG
ncbi:hypothetical protein CWB89_12795 [Pseudoalteromonas piscicida]|uniref:Uncharacterized protein n=1 Tax=Pseudoalteromonas piscicida TaxID=43662 RepID=A0AAQ2ESX4_PSEO7|nr:MULTISPECIES: hypothetical protein [Pseudoalteromonas]KJY89977.1 hypothetical protein TW75_08230 [Pseudoalteromonas piscicida]TMN39291.1 hypothetical protein CWB94_12690 [Pseudoalteromonas piscicida]TMN40582.1 hypothetical protein CWB95_10505 [Pseudoalteromonas piscicida]TMN49889.1 hypothetical protein CWB92_14645 [Pseudoalteromonas piscicida]TMN53941.1 hypothetical protein CWB91_09025 [Pseudoalteromonas piscicida]